MHKANCGTKLPCRRPVLLKINLWNVTKTNFLFPPHALFSSESTPIKRKVQGKVHYIRRELGGGGGGGVLAEKRPYRMKRQFLKYIWIIMETVVQGRTELPLPSFLPI